MKNINDIILNPIRMRIIQLAAMNKDITASDLCDKMADIPRTTVYRHIKILIDNNLLTVVSERKVRGSLERVLSFNAQEIASHNTIENATQNAYQFLMNKYASFQKYFSAEHPDPAKDRIFLNNSVMMATDEEFDAFLNELRELLLKYNYEYTEDRKPRDISLISAPCKL